MNKKTRNSLSELIRERVIKEFRSNNLPIDEIVSFKDASFCFRSQNVKPWFFSVTLNYFRLNKGSISKHDGIIEVSILARIILSKRSELPPFKETFLLPVTEVSEIKNVNNRVVSYEVDFTNLDVSRFLPIWNDPYRSVYYGRFGRENSVSSFKAYYKGKEIFKDISKRQNKTKLLYNSQK